MKEERFYRSLHVEVTDCSAAVQSVVSLGVSRAKVIKLSSVVEWHYAAEELAGILHTSTQPLNVPERLVCWIDADHHTLGFATETQITTVSLVNAAAITLETLLPAKGGGGVFITLRRTSGTLMLAWFAVYTPEAHSTLEHTAKRLASLAALPFEAVDMGVDV